MKNTMLFLRLIALLMITGFAIIACGGGNTPGDDPPLTGTVSIDGTAQVGQTLTANTSNLGGSGAIYYQWERNGNIIGYESDYHVQYEDIGYIITITVTRSGNSGSVTSNPVGPVIDPNLPALTGTVSISGGPWVGQMLTADTNSLGGSGTIYYQWKRGSTYIGTNSSTYVIQTADLGSTITVTVTRTGNSESVTSEPTATIILPSLTGTVSISGGPWVGQMLTADTNSLGGSGTIYYQWKRGGHIIGYDEYYHVQNEDIGYSIILTITRSGNSGSLTSNPVGPVTDPSLPVLTGTVSISGTAEAGHMLTANTNSLGGSGMIYYQWECNGNIIGYDSYYHVQNEDIGYTITVTVTRSGNSDHVTSPATDMVIGRVSFDNLFNYGSATQTTTSLYIGFNQEIPGLTADDIEISGISNVQKGTLNHLGYRQYPGYSGYREYYQLPISGFTAGGMITVEVSKTGYVINPTSQTTTVFVMGTVTLNITFTQIVDAAPSITGPTLYRVSNEGPTSAIITVDNPSQYDSISWRVQDTAVTGTGEFFILGADNTAYNLIGEHFVTVSVMKDGAPYNKTVSFKVEY